eukprot:TRINITY_DN54679_c0_g1_i1.p1 TRINITY_DN54679_c0_g1~~TRINITY_DN54679_c0_g1_i1.p1  ORF type:complete len:361 (-),score=60.93 TRINITY_DN54679_c0_g1_i1:188-1123(-)
MAAAVSNAGGLGTISALTQGSPEKLRAEIQKCRSLTDKPFAVNFTVLPAMVIPDYHNIVQAAIDEGVTIVQTAGNSPDRIRMKDGRSLLRMLKDAGMIVIHKCMSVKHALAAERGGVDVVSLGAYEYGGHIGNDEVTHWVSQPTAAQKLKVPLLVAGATAHGSQLAAALALGADGVEIGTGFMATQEAPIHAGMKDAIVKADEQSTILILRKVGNVGRFYKNDLTKKVKEIEDKMVKPDFAPLAEYVTGKRTYASLHTNGDPDDSAWTCGMAGGFINEIPTCAQFVQGLVDTAETIIKNRLQALVAPASRL